MASLALGEVKFEGSKSLDDPGAVDKKVILAKAGVITALAFAFSEETACAE